MSNQTPDSSAGTSGKGGLGAGAIASLTGVGLLALFMVQNTQEVTVEFLVWSFAWPLWFYGLLMALIGAMVWFGMGVMRRRRRRKARRAAR